MIATRRHGQGAFQQWQWLEPGLGTEICKLCQRLFSMGPAVCSNRQTVELQLHVPDVHTTTAFGHSYWYVSLTY